MSASFPARLIRRPLRRGEARRRIACPAHRFGTSSTSSAIVVAAPAAPPAADAAHIPLRMIVVHWRIRRDAVDDFLDYWSTRSVIEDRSGLVSEFLSAPEDRGRLPWIAGHVDDPRWVSFYNIGTWRDEAAFQDQIGRFIDDARPPMPFEAARRERVLLAPERWRIGRSALPAGDAPNVL